MAKNNWYKEKSAIIGLAKLELINKRKLICIFQINYSCLSSFSYFF